jgi:hypothetical protein
MTGRLILALVLLLLTACGPAVPDSTATPTAPAGSGGTLPPGYPAPTEVQSGYPGPAPTIEGLVDEPPDPEVDLPSPEGETGVLGGVLIREITNMGFTPLVPKTLSLANILSNDLGTPTFISAGADSPQAQLLPTGVFIFNDVQPGTYGLMVDLGYAQFPVNDEEGNPRLIAVEPGQAVDLGQVIVTLPGE